MYIEPFKPREKLGRVILSPTGPQWYLDEDACNRLNPIIRAYNRFLKMHVGGRAHKRGDGSIVVDPVPKRFWARLTNDSPSYSWVEVTPDAIGSTTWEPIAGGRAGENAREYNERSTPEGTVVWMELWDGGQERFFEDREGEAPEPKITCSPCSLPKRNLEFTPRYNRCVSGTSTQVTLSPVDLTFVDKCLVYEPISGGGAYFLSGYWITPCVELVDRTEAGAGSSCPFGGLTAWARFVLGCNKGSMNPSSPGVLNMIRVFTTGGPMLEPDYHCGDTIDDSGACDDINGAIPAAQINLTGAFASNPTPSCNPLLVRFGWTGGILGDVTDPEA